MSKTPHFSVELLNPGFISPTQRCVCSSSTMVWSLSPVDPLPGENQYYFFSKGTYKVGRKGCDIIIRNERTVSRVHSEIIVDGMICMDHIQNKSSESFSKVRIRDCSKYGTFVNKNEDSRKVIEFPNKEKYLMDGDLLVFGSGDTNYRFSFVSLVFFACSTKPSQMNQLQDRISSVGASVTRKWSLQCTHVVIDDFTVINDEIIDALVAKKPLVGFSWIELIAGKTICTEIPSFLAHTPTLELEGESIKMTDPKSRENCLEQYTFLLESVHQYKFKEKLRSLLEVAGAKVIDAEALDSQNCIWSTWNLVEHLVCVIPFGMTSNPKYFHNFKSSPKVDEIKLISAVASGHLDPSIIRSAPVLVTSSCSTDETVVADSDMEIETVTSVHTSTTVHVIESDDEDDDCKAEYAKNFVIQESPVHIIDSSGINNTPTKANEPQTQGFLHPNRETLLKSDDVNIALSREVNDSIVEKKGLDNPFESGNLDIIYSQNLIVRETNFSRSGQSIVNGSSVNFKRFRKHNGAPSGNSFSNLIPFSKRPYEASDLGNEDVTESVKEEKKRKQMEAIAEDLFNNDKGRKRGGAGTIYGMLARG